MSLPTLAFFGVSSYSLDLNIDYEIEYSGERLENVHRTRDGGLYVYTWGTFKKFKLPVSYVNSNFRSVVNSWWESGAELVLTTENGTSINSVQLRNKSIPIAKVIKPYEDQFQGTLILETY